MPCAECSDSTNYAPRTNAKCIRNKPRARMPPNGRNCTFLFFLLYLLLLTLLFSYYMPDVRVHQVLKDICASAKYRCHAAGKRARVNVPRGSLASFSPLYFSASPVSFLSVEISFFILVLSSYLTLLWSFLLFLSFLLSLLPCIIPVTRRSGILHTQEHTPLALSLLHKRNSGTREEIGKVTRDQTPRGLCVLCALGFYRVYKTEFFPRHIECKQKKRERRIEVLQAPGISGAVALYDYTYHPLNVAVGKGWI